jgi:hypothetical protein
LSGGKKLNENLSLHGVAASLMERPRVAMIFDSDGEGRGKFDGLSTSGEGILRNYGLL